MMPTRTLLRRACAILMIAALYPGRVTLRAQEPSANNLPPGSVARLGNASFWHGQVMRALAFAPDESLVASFGNDYVLRVWDTAGGKLKQRIPCPQPALDFKKRVTLTAQGPVLMFSGDGTTLAAADLAAHVCRLWDVATGKEVAVVPLSHSEEDVEPPAGLILPVGAIRSRRGIVGAFALSHDGRRVARAQVSGTDAIHVFERGTAEPVRKLAGHSLHPTALAFAPDGKTLASAGENHALCIWDLETGKLTRTLPGHRAAVQVIAFAPTGARLLSAALDGTVRVWDAGKELARSEWRPARLSDVEAGTGVATSRVAVPTLQSAWFDPDGRHCGVFFTLAFGTSGICEDVLCRFDAATGKPVSRQIVHDHRGTTTSTTLVLAGQVTTLLRGPVTAAAPRQGLLARTTASHHVQLVSWATGLPARAGLFTGITDVEMAGDVVAVVQQDDPAVYLWSWKTNAPLRTLAGHTGHPFLLGFTPRASLLVSASRDAGDRSLSVWNVAAGTEQRQVASWNPGAAGASATVFSTRTASAPSVPAPALSPDGKRLAFRGSDGKLHVVEVATGADVVTPDFDWRGDGCLAFTPDGQRLLVSDHFEPRRVGALVLGAAAVPAKAQKSDAASHLHIVDAVTARKLGVVNRQSYDFGIARFAVSGRHAVAGCKDGLIRLIDLDSGKAVRDIWLGQAATRPNPLIGITTINRAPFFVTTHDGRMVALRSPENSSLRILEVATGQERLTLPVPSSHVTSMGFDREGRHLVTGNQEGTVLVWALGPSPDGAATVDALWQDLGQASGEASFRALRILMARPADAVQLVSTHLQPVAVPNEAEVLDKIRALDSPNFAARQKAQNDLGRLGDAIRGLLDKAAAAPDASEEAKRRLSTLLKRLDTSAPTGETLRELRALELLERLGTKDAADQLQRLAGGAASAFLTREARAALVRLTRAK